MSGVSHVIKDIRDAFDLLPKQMESDEAWLLLLVIGLQESGFRSRRQIIQTDEGLKPIGPAVSYWQFEENGGIRGILRHPASRYWVHQICAARSVKPTRHAIWLAMQHDDVLGAACARLLLFCHPRKLPKIGDVEAAWEYYLSQWRPGKPKPETWPEFYAKVLSLVGSAV